MYDGLRDLARSIDGVDVGAASDATTLAEAHVLYDVISAILAGDATHLAEQIHYMQVACTDIGALGRPPLCRDGEEVGIVRIYYGRTVADVRARVPAPAR